MTKVLHTGDLHLGSFPGPERNGQNVRFEIMCNLLDQIVERASDKGVDIAILAGDLWHQAKVWADRGLREQAVMVRFVSRLAELCPVIVMRGTPNHDSAEQFKALEMTLRRLPTKYPVWVVTKPGVHVVQDRAGVFLNVACLPGYDREIYEPFFAKYLDVYPSESAAATVAINDLVQEYRRSCASGPVGRASVLVGHFTMQGCDMESGQTAFFSETEPVVVPQVVSGANYDLVCFNHIHKRQEIKDCARAFYSGSVTQLNFNDEGQERGFYVHSLNDDGTLSSEFVELSGTEFLTIWLNEFQVKTLVDGGDVPELRAPEVADKIVRVKYSCTDVTNKAFRHSDAEKRLYDAGAFYVAEVSPVSVTTTMNGLTMSADVSPEVALTNYLLTSGKDRAEVQELVTLAKPLLDAAAANVSTERQTGLFMPVSIAVKNYRNYPEQEFSFENVKCCTINGENGVGKSSLFMDAIVDCIFEEPREGDLAGWIRNDPKAKSGKISFTFRLGDKEFRIERTRAKSGKSTLALFGNGDDGWKNLSCSRARDTQQKIVDLIGMDCQTFKSCALIMQDQYGLFLCADKAARMGTLSSILGLGIYDDLEDAADRARADENREIKAINASVDELKASMLDEAVLTNNIKQAEARVAEMDAELSSDRREIQRLQAELVEAQSAQRRVTELAKEYASLLDAKGKAVDGAEDARKRAGLIRDLVGREAEIVAGVKELERAEAARTERGKDVARVESVVRQVAVARENLTRESTEREKFAAALATANERVTALRASLSAVDEAEILARQGRLEAVDERLNEMLTVLRPRNVGAENAVRDAERELASFESDFKSREVKLDAEIRGLREQAALLDSETGCVDLENADCVFLRAAKAAKSRIEVLEAEKAALVAEREAGVREREGKLAQLRALVDATLNERIEAAQSERAALRSVANERAEFENLKKSVETAEEQVKMYGGRVEEAKSRVERAAVELRAVSDIVLDEDEVRKSYAEVSAEVDALSHWREDERNLALAKVKLESADAEVARLERESAALDARIKAVDEERASLADKSAGVSFVANALATLNNVVDLKQSGRDKQAEALGGLRREYQAMQDDLARIAELERDRAGHEVASVRYGVLKQAFSQDGIRHNIIKSVIPMLESTASAILGQMSGGHMSVELVTEKVLKSNSKREVAALDVIINDDVTGRLPYMSRSGGEQVKASLSVILALARIKGSQAGIQLGFLGIDEPPYLDGKGVQAYCDALDAIQVLYPDMKVMAISHDESMKGRFPQSVTVVKTADGSRLESVV